MSKHVDPAAELSPKVKALGITGAALTVLATALAAGIAAIPDEAWDGLGVWGVPVGVFVGALGAGIAAYAKGDWLREMGAAAVTAGEVPTGLPHPDAVPEVDETLAPAEALHALAQNAGSTKVGGVS